MLRRSALATALGAAVLAAPASAQYPPPAAPALPAITIRAQTDGVNSQRVVTVAAFCRGPAPCSGTAKLTKGGRTLGKAPFTAAGKTTFKTPIRLSATVFRALHRARGKKMTPLLTLTMADGHAFSHLVTIKL